MQREDVLFGIQACISAVVVLFSISMLASGRGDTSIYLPVLTSITSIWLPSPASGRKMPDLTNMLGLGSAAAAAAAATGPTGLGPTSLTGNAIAAGSSGWVGNRLATSTDPVQSIKGRGELTLTDVKSRDSVAEAV